MFVNSSERFQNLNSFESDFYFSLQNRLTVSNEGIGACQSWQLWWLWLLGGCLLHAGSKRQNVLPSGGIHIMNESLSTSEFWVLLRLCKIHIGFYPPATYAMAYLHVWIPQQRKRQNKTKEAHNTHTHTQWDCAPLFCIFCNPDCGNYLPGFTRLFFHSKGSFRNRVTLNSV